MAKKLTTEEFIKRAKEVHGDRYDYSSSDYKSYHNEINIICKNHGKFVQLVNNHLSGKGCNKCYLKTYEQFLVDANTFHNNKYDYSLVNYINRTIPIKILCPIHGEFSQVPQKHLIYGCHKCRSLSTETLISRAKILHGDIFNYNKMVCNGYYNDIIITCPKHGDIITTPNNLLYSIKDCKKCKNESYITNILNICKVLHKNKYDYSKVKINDDFTVKTKVIIICPIHNEFIQCLHQHSLGQGCIKCSGKEKSSNIEFIMKANHIHNNKYDYSEVDYFNAKTEVKIICKKHGEFFQSPNKHLGGRGCKKCGKSISKPETIWLDSLEILLENRNIFIYCKDGKKYNVDGYDPTTKTIYEFYGDYWHGNLKKYKPEDLNKRVKKTFGELYLDTQKKEISLIKEGYNLISMWESSFETCNKNIMTA